MNAWWDEVWQTVQGEFSDISDPMQLTRVVVRLTVAVALGGLLGYERELRGTSAGLRTHMLVALGSALFVLVPLEAGITPADLSRVLQGVIAGIGFLGAGAIIKLSQEQEIKGLTTAASVWLTAAIGVAAGMGRESTAIVSTLFALFILAVLRKVIDVEQSKKERRAQSAQDDKA
jgi:putative Mg2+ transporter-C (MgtC) family protein